MYKDRAGEGLIVSGEPGRDFERYWGGFRGNEIPRLREVFGVGKRSDLARIIFEEAARRVGTDMTFEQPGTLASEARVSATLGGETVGREITSLLTEPPTGEFAALDEAIRAHTDSRRRIAYMADHPRHMPREDAREIVRKNPLAFLAFLTREAVVWSTVFRQVEPQEYLERLDSLSRSIVMANVGARRDVDIVGSINTAIAYLKEIQAAAEFPHLLSVAIAELDRTVPRRVRFEPGFLRMMYSQALREKDLLRANDFTDGKVVLRGSIKTAGGIAIKALREDGGLREKILGLGLEVGVASAEEVNVRDPQSILEVERARFAAKIFNHLVNLAMRGDERLDGQQMIGLVERLRRGMLRENDIFRCRLIFSTLEGMNLAMSRAAQIAGSYSEEVREAMTQRLDADRGLGAYVKMLVDTREGREREAKLLLEELGGRYHDLPDVGGWMARRLVEAPNGSVLLLAQTFLLGHLEGDRTFRLLEGGLLPAALGTEIQMTTNFGEIVNQVHGPIYRNPFRTYRGAFGGADEAAGIVSESLEEAKRVARETMSKERGETI